MKVPPHLIRNRQFLFFFLPPPFRILGQWEGKRTIKEKGSSFTKVCTWGMNFQWDTTNICTFYFELKSKNNLCSIILVIEWGHFPSIENEGESLILWHKGLLYKGKKEGEVCQSSHSLWLKSEKRVGQVQAYLLSVGNFVDYRLIWGREALILKHQRSRQHEIRHSSKPPHIRIPPSKLRLWFLPVFMASKYVSKPDMLFNFSQVV